MPSIAVMEPICVVSNSVFQSAAFVLLVCRICTLRNAMARRERVLRAHGNTYGIELQYFLSCLGQTFGMENQVETKSLLGEGSWHNAYFTGRWQKTESVFNVIEPATSNILGHIGLAEPEHVAGSCKLAHECQTSWAASPYEERAALFHRAVSLAEQFAEEISDWLVREAGSIRPKADFEVALTIKALREAAALPSKATGELLPSAPGRLSIARRRPLGVVGVISPFNFPLYLAIRAVAPALALGNAVVLKPDPRTAVSGGAVIARLFELAGLPEGLLHVLPGGGETGAALCADPNVAMIQFTGSTAAGKKVGEAAGRNLKKVSLELGGKNSLILFEDADLETALSNAAWGVYLHQGQICMSTGRILVHRSIHDEFVTRLVEKARALAVGDPATEQVALGPLISPQQFAFAADVVAAAVRHGARLEVGGGGDSLFFQPTVLSSVSVDNPAFNEEIFAPVAVVTAFDTDDEAVKMANHGDYGLSTGIISKDVGRALAVGEKLRTGLLHINDQTVNDEVVNPFGGVGASGNGTSIGGPANIEEFTQWQWLTIKGEANAYPL